jgi:carboxyl-terminal processing protease
MRSNASRHQAIAVQQALMNRLAGPPGSPLALTLSDGRRSTVRRLVRDSARGITTKFGNLPALAVGLSWRQLPRGDRKLGVIRFSLWMPAIAPAFDAALDSLRGSDGIILDLRGNLGGVGGMVTGIAGHFFDTAATIGTMRQRGATFRFLANPRRTTADGRQVTPYAGPLVLLVDELSASTSEIFAAGLQALGRAHVVGVRTPGEALPSVPERLPNGDVLYHAIADFVSPLGAPIEGRGVTPDLVVPLSIRALRAVGDPPMEAALAWLATRPRTLPLPPSPVSGR